MINIPLIALYLLEALQELHLKNHCSCEFSKISPFLQELCLTYNFLDLKCNFEKCLKKKKEAKTLRKIPT